MSNDSRQLSAIRSHLYQFAQYFLKRHGAGKALDPEFLAESLRDYLGISGNLTKSDLSFILKERLGIDDISPMAMSPGNRGLNVKLGNKINLLYKIDDWDGSQEFTILHELREILGYIFKELDPSFQDADGEELENQADAFAAAFLMERKGFLSNMMNSGLDPVQLHKIYHKSYVGVISRMASILRIEKSPFALWGSVLEYDLKAPDGYFRAVCFHRNPSYKPRARYRVPNYLFPKRGQFSPIVGSLELALESRRAVFVKSVRGLDFWNRFCLAAMIRPVSWRQQVAKLLIVAVREEDSHLFGPQILSADPQIIDKSLLRL